MKELADEPVEKVSGGGKWPKRDLQQAYVNKKQGTKEMSVKDLLKTSVQGAAKESKHM